MCGCDLLQLKVPIKFSWQFSLQNFCHSVEENSENWHDQSSCSERNCNCSMHGANSNNLKNRTLLRLLDRPWKCFSWFFLYERAYVESGCTCDVRRVREKRKGSSRVREQYLPTNLHTDVKTRPLKNYAIFFSSHVNRDLLVELKMHCFTSFLLYLMNLAFAAAKQNSSRFSEWYRC